MGGGKQTFAANTNSDRLSAKSVLRRPTSFDDKASPRWQSKSSVGLQAIIEAIPTCLSQDFCRGSKRLRSTHGVLRTTPSGTDFYSSRAAYYAAREAMPCRRSDFVNLPLFYDAEQKLSHQGLIEAKARQPEAEPPLQTGNTLMYWRYPGSEQSHQTRTHMFLLQR